MQRTLDMAAMKQEMTAVTAKLDAPGISREDRLTLLRRQALLVDLRDAVAQRDRRSDR